jgi:MurNAc alpha-1-phosphate uridylyltransferase
MRAMIFAAGLGTRLHPLTLTKPKALVEVAGKTLLQRSVELLKLHGIDEIVVNVHHFSQLVRDYLTAQNNFGINIHISDESDLLLDTGGGLKKASRYFEGDEPLLVLNSDVVSNINLSTMIEHHKKTGALSTLAVRKRESNRNFLFNPSLELCGWQNVKEHKEILSRVGESLHPLAFSGIQVVSPQLFSYFPQDAVFSLVQLYLEAAKNEKIVGFQHDTDYWFDAGSIRKIEQIERFFQPNMGTAFAKE